jgi:hypothetical protein
MEEFVTCDVREFFCDGEFSGRGQAIDEDQLHENHSQRLGVLRQDWNS